MTGITPMAGVLTSHYTGCFFTALTISLLCGGPGIFSTLKPASDIAFRTIDLEQ